MTHAFEIGSPVRLETVALTESGSPVAHTRSLDTNRKVSDASISPDDDTLVSTTPFLSDITLPVVPGPIATLPHSKMSIDGASVVGFDVAGLRVVGFLDDSEGERVRGFAVTGFILCSVGLSDGGLTDDGVSVDG